MKIRSTMLFLMIFSAVSGNTSVFGRVVMNPISSLPPSALPNIPPLVKAGIEYSLVTKLLSNGGNNENGDQNGSGSGSGSSSSAPTLSTTSSGDLFSSGSLYAPAPAPNSVKGGQGPGTQGGQGPGTQGSQGNATPAAPAPKPVSGTGNGTAV